MDGRPEPVMNASYLAGALITLVKLLLVMLATLGIVDLTDGEQATIAAVVAGLADVVIIVATMWYGARQKVTPLASPEDATGTRLSRPDNSDAVTQKELN